MKVNFGFEKITCTELARACGGILNSQERSEISLTGICTDSKEAAKGLLFAALRGTTFSGSDFVPAALQAGADAALTDRPCNLPNAILVEDTQKSLQKLGSFARQKMKGQVVAVTGSVGKTTAKEMIFSVLSQKYKAYRSNGNRNNQLGVPLSLMECPCNVDWSVFELGMNHAGEIATLAKSVLPNIAVITNIGTAHIGNLSSKAEIAKAKFEIIQGLSENGFFIYPYDEPLLKNETLPNRSIGFSMTNPGADCFGESITEDADGTSFDLCIFGDRLENIRILQPGKHFVNAAILAATVGRLAGESAEEIRNGILECNVGEMRQKIFRKNGYTLIDDCYNASPESMESAIEVLAEEAKRSGGKSICVLGEMLELGEKSLLFHLELGRKIAAKSMDFLYTYGKNAKEIANGAKEAGMNSICSFEEQEDFESVAKRIFEEISPPCTLLLKASHAVGFEKLALILKKMMDKGEG